MALGPRRRGREPPTVCNTSDTHCDFTAPAGTRRVYLSAYNAAGESAATEVVLLERKGEGLKEHLSWAERVPLVGVWVAFLTWLRPQGRVSTHGVPKEAPHEALRQRAGARGALSCREQGWAAPLCPQPRGCPHAGQPLAGLRAVPAGERSLWVHWEAPGAPVAAYVLEWQRVASEPGRCSACWQMERDGAATSALIQGKQGVLGRFQGGPSQLCRVLCPRVSPGAPSSKSCPEPTPHAPSLLSIGSPGAGTTGGDSASRTPSPQHPSALRCRRHRALPALQHLGVPPLQGCRRDARPHSSLLQAEGCVCCQHLPS